MATLPLPEPVQYRFPHYIEEVREFFSTCHLPFGSPDDLPPLVDLLAQPGPFSEDLASLVRSIVLREGGAMPHVVLQQILAYAIAGPQLSQSAHHAQQQLQPLLDFVAGVMRRPWGEPAQVVPFPTESSGPHPSEPPAIPPVTQSAAESDHKVPVTAPTAPQRHPSAIGAALADRHREPLHTAPSPEASLSDEPRPDTPRPIAPGRPRRLALPIAWAGGTALAVLLIGLAWQASRTKEIYRIQPVPTALSPSAPPAQVSQPFVPQQVTPSAINPHISAPPQRLADHRLPRSSATIPVPSTPPPALPAAPPQLAAAPAQPPAPNPSYTANPTRFGFAVRQAPVAAGVRPVPNPSTTSLPSTRVTVSSGIMAANLIYSPDPSYPRLARIADVEGQVILQAVVAKDGTVSATRVLRGPRLLRGAAQDAVRRWRFRPFLIDSHPVDVATIITVDFHDPT